MNCGLDLLCPITEELNFCCKIDIVCIKNKRHTNTPTRTRTQLAENKNFHKENSGLSANRSIYFRDLAECSGETAQETIYRWNNFGSLGTEIIFHSGVLNIKMQFRF